MNLSYENITLRRRKTVLNASFESIDHNRRHKTVSNRSFDLSFESTNSEIRRFSLPDLSTVYDSDKDDLKEELLQLRNDLESAHLEIAKLNEENVTLKNALNKQKYRSRTLQKICSESKVKATSSKKKCSKKTTKNLCLSFEEEMNTSCVNLGLKNNNNSEFSTDGAASLSCEALQDINGNCGLVSNTLSTSLTKEPIVLKNKNLQIDNTSSLSLKQKQLELANSRSKICIISSNKVNTILSISQNTFPCHNVCHFISTNCGVKQLLINLKHKLLNYNKHDYCLIFIGEKDFEHTVNYYELVISIRELLMSINYTNIILCLPTYKFNGHSNIYNSRIECFNNILYSDICTYNYAMLYDSNLNLEYCDTMFYKLSGVINNHGMRRIFSDLKYHIDKQNLSTRFLPIKPNPRKGTIPFYFPVVNKTLDGKTFSVNNSSEDTTKKPFFREQL